MGMESTLTKRVINMKGNGKTICLMGKAKLNIQMKQGMLGNFSTTKNMEEELYFKPVTFIEGILKTIFSMESSNLLEKMEKLTRVSGKKIKSMAMEYTYGLMVVDTKVSIVTIRKMEKEPWCTVMEMSTMGSGWMD